MYNTIYIYIYILCINYIDILNIIYIYIYTLYYIVYYIYILIYTYGLGYISPSVLFHAPPELWWSALQAPDLFCCCRRAPPTKPCTLCWSHGGWRIPEKPMETMGKWWLKWWKHGDFMETWWEHGGKHGDFMDFLKKERERYIYICHICLFFWLGPMTCLMLKFL